MTDIDVLDWMKTARKAGNKTFLVDVNRNGKLIVGAKVVSIHQDSILYNYPYEATLVSEYGEVAFENLSNPRLPPTKTFDIKEIAQALNEDVSRRFCNIENGDELKGFADGGLYLTECGTGYGRGLLPNDVLATYREVFK